MTRELIEKLIEFCRANNLGFASLQDPETKVMVLVIGPKEYSPDTISIAAASMLLHGVLTGMSRASNDVMSEAEKSPLN